MHIPSAGGAYLSEKCDIHSLLLNAIQRTSGVAEDDNDITTRYVDYLDRHDQQMGYLARLYCPQAESLLDYVQTHWTAGSHIEDISHVEALRVLLLIDSIKHRAAVLCIEAIQSGSIGHDMALLCVAAIRVMISELYWSAACKVPPSRDIDMLQGIGEACIGPMFEGPLTPDRIHSFVVCSKLLPTLLGKLDRLKDRYHDTLLMTQHIDLLDSMFFVQWDSALLLPVAEILCEVVDHLTSPQLSDLRTRMLDAVSQQPPPMMVRGGEDCTGLLAVALRLLERSCDPAWLQVVRTLYRRYASNGAIGHVEALWGRMFTHASELLLCALEDMAVQYGKLLVTQSYRDMSTSIPLHGSLPPECAVAPSDVCLALLIGRALGEGANDCRDNGEVSVSMSSSAITTEDSYIALCQSQLQARVVFMLLLVCAASAMWGPSQHHPAEHRLDTFAQDSLKHRGYIYYIISDLLTITCPRFLSPMTLSNGDEATDDEADGWVYASRSREMSETLIMLGAYPLIAEQCVGLVVGWAEEASLSYDEHGTERMRGVVGWTYSDVLRECQCELFRAVKDIRTAMVSAIVGRIISCSPTDCLVDASGGRGSGSSSSARKSSPGQASLCLFSTLLLDLCEHYPSEIASAEATLLSSIDGLGSYPTSIVQMVVLPLVLVCPFSRSLYESLIDNAMRAVRDSVADKKMLAIRSAVALFFAMDDEIQQAQVADMLSRIFQLSEGSFRSEMCKQLLHCLDGRSFVCRRSPSTSTLRTLKRLVDQQLSVAFSSKYQSLSLHQDGVAGPMPSDANGPIRLLDDPVDLRFDPALHMRKSKSAAGHRWVFTDDIHQLVILSGRIEQDLHGDSYLDPFLSYLLSRDGSDNFLRVEQTESWCLIATMISAVEFIRRGGGADDGKTLDDDGKDRSNREDNEIPVMSCERSGPVTLDRSIALVYTYAALDGIIHCMVRSLSMRTMDDAGDRDSRDVTKALRALIALADVLMNVLVGLTRDEVSNHDSCMRMYRSHLSDSSVVDHIEGDNLCDHPAGSQRLASSRHAVIPSSLLSIKRMLRRCTDELLPVEDLPVSMADGLSLPYSLQCGVFNYWCSYIARHLSTLPDQAIAESSASIMELLHQLEVSYRSLCLTSLEQHWLTFHQSKHKQLSHAIRTAAAKRRRYHTRARSSRCGMDRHKRGRRMVHNDGDSDDVMADEDDEADSYTSDDATDTTGRWKGFVLSPSETMSHNSATDSNSHRSCGIAMPRLIDESIHSLPAADRQRMHDRYWDLSHWRWMTMGEEQLHEQVVVAAWSHVRQSVRAALDAMRGAVLTAIAAAVACLRCSRHTNHSDDTTDSITGSDAFYQSSIGPTSRGFSSDRDGAVAVVHRLVELLASELLEVVKEGTTLRTFNAYVSALTRLSECMEDERMLPSSSSSSSHPPIVALSPTVGGDLLRIIPHLTAPHTQIIRSVLALAVKFLGTLRGLEQIGQLVYSMTTGHGESAGRVADVVVVETVHPKVADGVLKELLQCVSTTALHDNNNNTEPHGDTTTIHEETIDGVKQLHAVSEQANPTASHGIRIVLSLFSVRCDVTHALKGSTAIPDRGVIDKKSLRIDALSDHRASQVLDLLVRIVYRCIKECQAILKVALHLRKVTNFVHRCAMKKRDAAFDSFKDPFDDDGDDCDVDPQHDED